jgi:hypothetical protein
MKLRDNRPPKILSLIFIFYCWIDLITALSYGLQVAVFYPSEGQYEIQKQARSRTESPQIISSKISCLMAVSLAGRIWSY